MYSLRVSLEVGENGDTPDASGGEQASSRTSLDAANPSGASGRDAEAQAMPYMCLAQCLGTESRVGHQQVPALHVSREAEELGHRVRFCDGGDVGPWS